MCSCSANTQTVVYETMESAGGTSNRDCSMGSLGGGVQLSWKETMCHFGTEDVAEEQRDHLLKW